MILLSYYLNYLNREKKYNNDNYNEFIWLVFLVISYTILHGKLFMHIIIYHIVQCIN